MAGFFGFFDYSKEGPGVSKDEAAKRGVALFFDTLFRKFGKLVSLNFLFFVVSLPVLAIYFIASSGITASLVQKISEIEAYIEISFLLNVMTAVVIMILLGAGPASAGFVYIMRNLTTGKHAWIFSDFFEHFKKNFRQGFAVLIIDCAFLFLIIANINFYTGGMDMVLPPQLRAVMSSLVFIFALFYIMMRMYLYPMMVTFELRLSQLYKNALLFLMMKLPQTLGIFILVLMVCAAAVYAAFFNILLGILIVPLIIYALTALIQMVYVYPAIMSIMASAGKEEGKS
jgi:uncharacterized membrane protein YesL